jgi:hypothetical protein
MEDPRQMCFMFWRDNCLKAHIQAGDGLFNYVETERGGPDRCPSPAHGVTPDTAFQAVIRPKFSTRLKEMVNYHPAKERDLLTNDKL